MSTDQKIVTGFEPTAAFDFSNCIRNMAMEAGGVKMPNVISTGTTIVAVIYKGGIIMGADSRVTQGNTIMEKHYDKVRRLTESVYACGAGTAADLDNVTKMLSAQLRLKELNTGKKARVITALRLAKEHLYRYQGYIGAYLLLGGVDMTGPVLYEVSAFGYTQAKPYATMGSGSYAAISVLERDFLYNMNEVEARDLIRRALEAGMHGDNASGNSYILIHITKKQTTAEGPFVPDFCSKSEPINLEYKFNLGATKVIKHKIIKYDTIESMDVSH